MYKSILVPTDGSALSAIAINEAATLAKEIGSRVVLFYSPLTAGLSPPIRPRERELAQKALAAEAEHVLSSAARNVNLAGLAVEQHFTVSHSPSEAIVEAAKAFHCDLIIMASHGRHGLSAVLHGSETQAVIRDSKVPVIVVH